jgi:hypothetical protein
MRHLHLNNMSGMMNKDMAMDAGMQKVGQMRKDMPATPTKM